MKNQILSREWTLVSNRLLHDLTPTGGFRNKSNVLVKIEHYSGDECWCVPHRIVLKHYSQQDNNLIIWVHRPSTNSGQRELKQALTQLVSHFDGIYRI